jgi:hypothetical protein
VVTTSFAQPPASSTVERASSRLRQNVAEILEFLQVPTPRHLLQDVLACRGVGVDMGQLSRLRRAEEHALRAGRAPGGPGLVPAISCLELCAIPGTLTCSTWSLEQRLVGMYTPRTRHLGVLLRLLDDAALLGSEAGQRLVSRLAETVPGAMQRGRMRDPVAVRTAAQAELAEIEPLDLAERRTAATRLAALAPAFQVWGQPALLATATDGAGVSRP